MPSYRTPDDQGTPIPTTAQAALALVLLVAGAALTVARILEALGR